MQAGGGAQPKFQKQGKGKSPGKNGKAKAKHAHSVVFKTVPSAKGTVSRLEGASASNSVTSEPTNRLRDKHPWQALIQENAFWHENEPRRVSNTDGPDLRTVPRRDWHS